MSDGGRPPRWEPWAVAGVAFLAHGASLAGGFLHWDDDRYIVRNLFVRDPTWEGLARLFTEPFYANYHPLHVASYAIDHAIFGDAAWGYHLINVLCFAGAAVLAARFLWRAFPGERWPRYAALLFAVHPVHVESVAWLSARKDVLALLFAMLYAVCHTRTTAAWSSRARVAWFVAGMGSFALALLSKAIVAPLPLSLLAYDLLVARRNARAAILAAAPPLVLAAAALAAAYHAQASEGAVMPYPGGSVWTGLLTSLTVFARYLGLLVAPVGLSAIYEVEPRHSLGDPAVLGSVALAAGVIAAALWALRRGAPIPLFALLFFVITLAPVSGVVPLSHAMADRYLLLPSLGFAIFVAWGLARLSGRSSIGRRAATAAGALFAAACLGLSASRSLDWESDLTLWTDTVTKAPGDPVVHVNLGAALADAGFLREAAVAFARALALRPNTPEARRNLGRVADALERRGDPSGAAEARRLLSAARAP
jgi:hypothetical protein